MSAVIAGTRDHAKRHAVTQWLTRAKCTLDWHERVNSTDRARVLDSAKRFTPSCANARVDE